MIVSRVLLVIGISFAASLGCDRSATPPASPPPNPAAASASAKNIDRYTDLLRLGEHFQQVEAGSRAAPEVWDLDRHYRPVLAQSGGRIVLGPIPGGESCRALFGIATKPHQGTQPVRFRMAVRGPEGVDRTVFEAAIDGASEAWEEHSVAIPDFAGQQFSIMLDLAAGDSAAVRGGWSAPHLICQTPRAPLVDLAHPHVILISLDTLRADHLGTYGYARDTSPVLDAFAAESTVFNRAFAPANWTLPSHASLFTGVSPATHGAGHASIATPLSASGPPTIAELLRDAGYWTIGFTAGGLMGRSNGLDRGFQWWTERIRANFQSTLPGVFDAIGTAPAKPLFLVLHTYDIHGPYAYLPGADAIQVGLRAGAAQRATDPACEGADCRDPQAEWKRIRASRPHEYLRLERFDGLDEVVDAYDRGIHFVDAQLGRLFDRLREIGIYDQSIIVITSDHGESLYDHALYLGHSYSLYDEELHVPLLVRLPGGSPGRSDQLVSLMDVLPLILETAGVPVPPSIEGHNPLAKVARAPDRTEIFGEASHTGARFARSGAWKTITSSWPKGDARNELPPALDDRFVFGEQSFDLAKDPHEQHDLASAPALAGPAEEALRAAARARPEPGARNDQPAAAVAPVEREQLRALGYLR